jgi:hypothetical protein
MNSNENPVIYDTTALVYRPMVPGSDQMTPALLPVSVTPGNQIQTNADGLYAGARGTINSPLTVYVNTSTGTNATTSGSSTTPYASFDYAMTQVQALFPGSLFNGYVNVALQAGQSFSMSADVIIYGGALQIEFYGDPQYGNVNMPFGTGANSQVMTDLERPVLTFESSIVAGLNHLAGFNRQGGSITFVGLALSLPAAPTAPSITLYTNYSDIVRDVNLSSPGFVNLIGTTVNMTDITSYWGFIGTHARSSGTTLVQYASEFLINGLQMSLANAPTTAQLTARQYFVKMYADYAGNNQQQNFLSTTSENSSTASGILNVTWADTESLTVASGKTNLASYPVCFDINYGFRNYIFGLLNDQQQRPTNVLSSRLF